MNPWPYILAAYGITLGGAAAIGLWAWSAMLRAERGVDELRNR